MRKRDFDDRDSGDRDRKRDGCTPRFASAAKRVTRETR
jgi:hypothetical protein